MKKVENAKKSLKIGNLEIENPVILAPLASITDIVFRKLQDEIGYCGYMVTELISVEGLRRRQEKTLEMIRSCNFKSPQFIQLFGTDPEAFLEAVKYIEGETSFAGIDINMGCPAAKVVKKGAGVALMKSPRQVAAIVRQVKKYARLPVTVKIRLGFNDVNVLEIVEILEQEGVDAIAVHFRLRGEGYCQEAKWQYAPLVREKIKHSMFIGNGDIKTAVDAREKLNIVDGVMIGRWAINNPLIFAEIAGASAENLNMQWVYQRLLQLVEEYYEPKFRLARIKAYTRFLISTWQYSKALRQQIYTSQSFEEVKQHFARFLE